jgi:hypothetical protein
MKGFIHPAAIFLAFALCTYAPAEGSQPVTSSVQIPLAGTVFVPLSEGSFNQVALSGMVHVVTCAAPGDPCAPTDPCRIQINLDQVFGVRDISGLRYNATGANRINLAFIPSDAVNLGFNLMPTDPDHPAGYFVHPYVQSGHGRVDERNDRIDVGAVACDVSG